MIILLIYIINGNFYEVLKHIEALSDKPEFSSMGGQTAFAVPAILVNGLSIAGK